MKKMYMYHFAIWILKNVFQIDLENFADKTYSEFDKVEKELVDLKKQNDLLKRELESIKEKTDKNIQQEIDDLLHKVKIFQERVDSIDPRISVDDEDLDNAFVDKYGVKYSRDIKRLLKASEKLDYKNYQVPEGVVVICNSAFKDIDIESVILPKSIVEIGKEAFYSCFELKSINIPNGVTVINQDTFYCCSNLKTIDLPDSVEFIRGNAFTNCRSMDSIVIPESVSEIGWEAFKDCTSLSSVKIPQSINRVDYGAFNNTPWYNNQPDGLVYVGKVAYKYKGNMPNDTVINIKDGTTEISDGAFYGCTGLTSIVIPNSVDYIGWKAFQGCI